MKFNEVNKNLLDYETAMQRFFNDEKLYTQAIEMFCDSKILENLKESYKNNDYQKIFQNAHELKGAAGNLSLTALYNDASNLTETVRDGIKNISQFEKAYSNCINSYTETLNYLSSKK